MPFYEYRCRFGHSTDKLYAMNDRHPRSIQCSRCRGRARRAFSFKVTPDIPPHFNSAFGHEVHSRVQLKNLQRQHGCEDFEPDRETRDRLQYGHEKSLAGARR
jgi:putative FmdB family regulatory protein